MSNETNLGKLLKDALDRQPRKVEVYPQSLACPTCGLSARRPAVQMDWELVRFLKDAGNNKAAKVRFVRYVLNIGLKDAVELVTAIEKHDFHPQMT